MKKVLSVILTVCFILPLLITHAVYAEENEAQTFVDVPESAWYCDSVKYVSENGLMKGTSEATFSPDMTLSRAMVVTILYRMAGEPDVESADGGEMKFTDVKPHEWYTDAVLWAYNLGIVNGVEANTYAPDRDVTRAELATMLFRYVQKFTLSLPYDPTYPAYADADSIPEYAEHGVIILSRAGVINGKDGNRFDPKASATRAEAAALFSRFAEKATVQDFSLIESLGVSISVGVYIEREWILLGGDIFKTIDTLSLSVYFRDNLEELFNTEISVSVKLLTESGEIKYDLKRDDGDFGSSFSYGETPSAYVKMGDAICADVTVTSKGESETYRYFKNVHELW
ncbi:MAG: S-layer homology domain-containing protein [Clostridia bacterium]|nr:S-layer homology domain-containing protein [Clostridia bacterium]